MYKKFYSRFFDITDFPLLGKIDVPQAAAIPADCRFDAALVRPFLNDINTQNWVNHVTSLSSLPTRYCNIFTLIYEIELYLIVEYSFWYLTWADTSQYGVQGAKYIFDTMTQMCGSKCSVRYFQHSWAQPSVIVKILFLKSSFFNWGKLNFEMKGDYERNRQRIHRAWSSPGLHCFSFHQQRCKEEKTSLPIFIFSFFDTLLLLCESPEQMMTQGKSFVSTFRK